VRNCYEFACENQENLKLLYELGVKVKSAKDAYIANRASCLALMETIDVATPTIQELLKKKKNPSEQGQLDAHVNRLHEVLEEARKLVVLNTLPEDCTGWMKKKAWIMKRAVFANQTKETVSQLEKRLAEVVAFLGVAIQVDQIPHPSGAEVLAMSQNDAMEFFERHGKMLDDGLSNLMTCFTDQLQSVSTAVQDHVSNEARVQTDAVVRAMERLMIRPSKGLVESLKKSSDANGSANGVKKGKSIASIRKEELKISFKKKHLIGRGASGNVFRGIRIRDDLPVAFKKLETEFESDSDEDDEEVIEIRLQHIAYIGLLFPIASAFRVKKKKTSRS
jgi:hypothetical protein